MRGRGGGVRSGQSVGQIRKYNREDALPEVLRDPFLESSGFPQGVPVISPALRVPCLGKKGAAMKQAIERLQHVALRAAKGQVGLETASSQQRRQIDLEKLLGTSPRSLVVEAPLRSIRQEAPLDATFRCRLGGREVPQNLVRGRPGIQPISAVAAVERSEPALALDDRQAMHEASVLAPVAQCLSFCRRVRKQQDVRDVLPARARGRVLRQEL